MKKILCFLLAMLMLLGPAAFAEEERPAWLKGEDEVTGVITVYTTMDEGQQMQIEDVWYKYYPNCTIEWISDSIGTLVTRAMNEASNPVADIILGGLFESDDDSYQEVLEKYTPVNIDEQSVIDPDGYYVYLDIQYMCLVVNEDLEEELGITINGYADLLQPELKGKIIMADAAASSSAFRQLQTILAVMSEESYGDEAAWDYIAALMANTGNMTTSSSQVYKSTINGEYVVGLSYESIVQYMINNGADNVRLVYPVEGNTACASGGAMIKGCPNRVAAEAMLDLLGSVEVQEGRALENCARGTNRNYIYEGYPSDEEIGVVPLDFEYIAEHKEEMLDRWAETWAATVR